MTKYLFFTAAFITSLFAAPAFAKISSHSADSLVIKQRHHVRKFFVGTAMDAGIFSTAQIQRTYHDALGNSIGTANSTGTLRFSYVLNFGATFNFNFGRHFGMYTGLDLKNIGYIEKDAFTGNLTQKRRTYNVGVPLGIKIGNMGDKKMFGFLGAGIDAPINYREKVFSKRSQKTKYNEWFSDATPSTMPYVFAGLAISRGISFKLQYYPNNYVNQDYKKDGLTPNAGTTVHLILFSIGFISPFSRNPDIVKKRVSDLNTSSM